MSDKQIYSLINEFCPLGLFLLSYPSENFFESSFTDDPLDNQDFIIIIMHTGFHRIDY
jgi:hypothetical protein